MKRSTRLLAFAALACVYAQAPAQQTLVHLNAFPQVSVADGRSTTTISAELRDSGGRLVPDGTRVVFNTSLGTFRESITTTTNGVARAILVAGGQPGIARVTATPLNGGSSPATLEFEFVADRALLSSAREYVELVAPGMMHYTADTRLIGASGVNKGVSLRYRDITIEADDLQYTIPTYEVRARKARLKIGKFVRDFDALYIRLNQRRGQGLTTYMAPRPSFPIALPTGLVNVYLDRDANAIIGTPPSEERFGLVDVRPGGITATTHVSTPDEFELADLTGATSRVSAKKAVIFPNRQIQFHRAEIYVADSRVMRIPLFQLSLAAGNSPLVTEQLVNVQSSSVALNYPHYLALQPGFTSLLRFRTGDSYGRGLATSSGAFLDYEMSWNRGDEMDGGLNFRGIGRNDYSIGLRQYLRIDDRSTGNLQLEMPSGKSLFGSLGLSRRFDGFQMSLNGNANQTMRGLRQETKEFSFVVEKDPIKMGRLPFQIYFGVTASDWASKQEAYNNANQKTLIENSSSRFGLRSRLQSRPIPLDGATTFTTGFSVSRVTGTNVGGGVELLGTASLSRRINSSTSMVATYDYSRDGRNDATIGSHRVSLQTYMNSGRTGIRLFGSRSLDVNRQNLFADFEYRPNRTWVIRNSVTMDRYNVAGSHASFFDQQFSLGYVIGWRELGFVYSQRTNRIGIQLLGAGSY